MDPSNTITVPRLTFDQATQELHAHNKAIIAAISQQANSGDMSSWELANAYRQGLAIDGTTTPQEAEAARVTFLQRYDAWRGLYAALVSPIAASLGHPDPAVPAAVAPSAADATREASVADMFGAQSPAAAAPAVVPPAPPLAPAAPAAVPAAPGGRKGRTAWAQADVVKLTLAMTQAGDWTPQQRAQSFVEQARPDLAVDAVLAKAAELGLVDPGVASGNYELTDTDRHVMRNRVLSLVEGQVLDHQRLALLKYAMVELREVIKTLAG